MLDAIRSRRGTVATLILTALIIASPVATSTAEAYSYTPRRICAIDWREGTHQVKRLIRCAANHWHVNPDKALSIAHRESLFDAHAYNAWSCAEGIYQHLCGYWPGRAFDYGFRGRSAFNARANIIVTMKMVHRHGWGPWGG